MNECPVVLIYHKYILPLTLCHFWEILTQFIIIPNTVFPGELLRTFTRLDLIRLEQLCSFNCLEGLLTFVFLTEIVDSFAFRIKQFLLDKADANIWDISNQILHLTLIASLR